MKQFVPYQSSIVHVLLVAVVSECAVVCVCYMCCCCLLAECKSIFYTFSYVTAEMMFLSECHHRLKLFAFPSGTMDQQAPNGAADYMVQPGGGGGGGEPGAVASDVIMGQQNGGSKGSSTSHASLSH